MSSDEAFVYPRHLKTPTLSHQDACEFAANKPCIVVVPEVFKGIPVESDGSVYVRFLLNKPGFMGGQTEFPEDHIILVYEKYIQNHYKGRVDGQFWVPPIEPDLFYDMGLERTKTCVYAGKYRGPNNYVAGKYPKETVFIDTAYPNRRSILAKLLNESKTFYCFDKFSALPAEAALCGCPTIYIGDDDSLSRDEIEKLSVFGGAGVAFDRSQEQMDQALETLPLVHIIYNKKLIEFEEKMTWFIEGTQNGKW